jgi:hypothetical protein
MRNTIKVSFAALQRGTDPMNFTEVAVWGKDPEELAFQLNFLSQGYAFVHVKDDDPFYAAGDRWIVLDKQTILGFAQVCGQFGLVVPQWAMKDGEPTPDSPWNQPAEWPVSDGKRAGGKTGRGNNPFEQIIIVIGRIYDASARKPKLRQMLTNLLNDPLRRLRDSAI